MKIRRCLFLSLLIIASCSSQKDDSIHKVWKFVKYDIINRNPSQGFHFGTSDTIAFLDLTNKTTLKFLLENKKPAPQIPYEIADSVITMTVSEGRIRFKVGKLTDDTLKLVFMVDKIKSNNNLIEMVFKKK